ncbi:MAG: hypothetical protein ACRBBV_15830 [Paracoccaceae bacterium]
MLLRFAFLILAALSVSACGYNQSDVPASSLEDVQRATYRHNGAPELVLYTAISNSTGEGAHSALMVNASQRVIFDPAGTFRKEGAIVERGDVLFGATPRMVDSYTRFHARETYHVVVQRLPVPAATAEAVLQDVLSFGDVVAAMCTNSTSTVLSRADLPAPIRVTMFPKKLMEQFATVPGVQTRELFEYDSDDKSKVLEAYEPDRVAETLRTRRENGTTVQGQIAEAKAAEAQANARPKLN